MANEYGHTLGSRTPITIAVGKEIKAFYILRYEEFVGVSTPNTLSLPKDNPTVDLVLKDRTPLHGTTKLMLPTGTFFFVATCPDYYRIQREKIAGDKLTVNLSCRAK